MRERKEKEGGGRRKEGEGKRGEGRGREEGGRREGGGRVNVASTCTLAILSFSLLSDT